METSNKNPLYIVGGVVVVIVIIALLWNRPVAVNQPVLNTENNVPVVTKTPSKPSGTTSGTPKTTTAPSVSSGSIGSYYTPKGTKIDLPQIYTTSNPNDVIRVGNPGQNSSVSSPLTVSGSARGNWFFEAVFPVILLDSKGRVLARGQARAQSNWMTDEMVPFLATLTFARQSGGVAGQLILQKSNPSGLPQNDAYASMPVGFY